MMPVGLQIEQIVQNVNRRRADAERNERDKRIEEQRQLRELVRREQRDEYDQVLHPLMRAQRLNEHVEERFWLFENAADVRALPGAGSEPRIAANQDRVPRLFPDWQIHGRIPRIIKAAPAKKLRQPRRLVFAPQIRSAIAAQHVREDAQVLRYESGESRIRCGDEEDRPLTTLFGAQEFDQSVVVRQRGDIECDARGNLRLEMGASAQQPEWDGKQIKRVVLEQSHERLPKQIRFDHGAV